MYPIIPYPILWPPILWSPFLSYRLDEHILGEVLELLRHGGREQERLPLLLEVVHDLLHLVYRINK